MSEDWDHLLEAPFQKPKKEDKSKTLKENGKEKNKDRERDRDHSRTDKNKEKERDRRERDKDRDRRDPDKRRHDSSRRRTDEERIKRRSRSPRHSRSPRRTSNVGPKGRELPKEIKERRQREEIRVVELDAEQREAIEAERDSRTVFAQNLPIKASEEDMMQFFGKAGKVRDIRLISDRNSKKSKGFGYIEFFEREALNQALQLSGSQFLGQTITVQPTQSEKNKVASLSYSSAAMAGPTRLYVGSLHFNITEEDLKMVFAPFGEIEFINLHMDPETGRSKGFGFVQFRRAEDAKRALQQINGLELAGRQLKLKVGLVNDTKVESTGLCGELDDDEGGGLALNAHSRAILMSKFQRGGESLILNNISSAHVSSPPPAPVIPAQPSTCICLKNMFDPTTENDPESLQEIREDVEKECQKFGAVKHIYVDYNSQGFVYVKFSALESAKKAVSSLNHRWFAGKMISAEYMLEVFYHAKFPEVAR